MVHERFLERVHGFDPRVFALVRDFRGSISAEHGIGLLKREFLHFSRTEVELELMRGIKRALDPQGILNPGKIFE
jgi:FAD/FMN-containing dehydrogenase